VAFAITAVLVSAFCLKIAERIVAREQRRWN
jgi:hypothetical protein